MRPIIVLGLMAGWLASSRPASAQLDACGGQYFTLASRCELVVDAECHASCDLAGMLKACAADLAAICSGHCSLQADTVCTGDCGSTCEERCRVEDVVCQKNCVAECVVNCDSQCAGATNRDECKASCESTCAHDCKVKCDELPVDARCVEHCNQCCLGSCTAQANFDCQIDCQAPDFSACRQRLADACSAGCTGAGALFCDGQFVVAGDAIQQCLAALQEMGVEAHVEFKASARTGCSTGAAGGAGAALVMVLLGLLWRRRR